MSCLLTANVSGCRREPEPPARTMPFRCLIGSFINKNWLDSWFFQFGVKEGLEDRESLVSFAIDSGEGFQAAPATKFDGAAVRRMFRIGLKKRGVCERRGSGFGRIVGDRIMGRRARIGRGRLSTGHIFFAREFRDTGGGSWHREASSIPPLAMSQVLTHDLPDPE